MSFIESYKHLDKICGEMFETQYGVSAYIEEMLNNPHGSFLVRGWENDLKQLKHYRWIRNQIVHEPDCYEETMCEAGDDEWLDDFYERIINQTDPLALYLFHMSFPFASHRRSLCRYVLWWHLPGWRLHSCRSCPWRGYQAERSRIATYPSLQAAPSALRNTAWLSPPYP